MKTTFIKSGLNNYPFGSSRRFDVEKDELNAQNLKDLSTPTPMIEQQITPPAHVWDKIVSILDLQDNEKQVNQSNVNTTIQKKKSVMVSGFMLSISVVIYWLLK